MDEVKPDYLKKKIFTIRNFFENSLFTTDATATETTIFPRFFNFNALV
jgi:hypothetical protein